MTVLVQRHDTECFSAHALDFDIVCEGKTEGVALRKLKHAVGMYVRFAAKNNQLRNMFFPAPLEYWRQLAQPGGCDGEVD